MKTSNNDERFGLGIRIDAVEPLTVGKSYPLLVTVTPVPDEPAWIFFHGDKPDEIIHVEDGEIVPSSGEVKFDFFRPGKRGRITFWLKLVTLKEGYAVFSDFAVDKTLCQAAHEVRVVGMCTCNYKGTCEECQAQDTEWWTSLEEPEPTLPYPLWWAQRDAETALEFERTRFHQIGPHQKVESVYIGTFPSSDLTPLSCEPDGEVRCYELRCAVCHSQAQLPSQLEQRRCEIWYENSHGL